jgi:DNA/RNA-binding domain of Phe-tRNA-synthetase-like protein
MIALELPNVMLGIVEASEVRVRAAGAEQTAELDAACRALSARLTLEQAAEMPAVRAVRAMFRSWGLDPSKYRPSSEALIRRVVLGKGLNLISNVVDSVNLGSIETAWPYGLYDRAELAPPIVFRHGRDGETYFGIGRRVWHLAGRPVLADTLGPFGSPISDSTRSMVTERATSVLAVIFAPLGSAQADLERAVEQQALRLEKFCAARSTRVALLLP